MYAEAGLQDNAGLAPKENATEGETSWPDPDWLSRTEDWGPIARRRSMPKV